MAQNEDDANQRHRDMRMLMLSKQIESTERLVELKLKTSERMILGGLEAQVNFTIQLLMEKLERFSGELETMMQEKRRRWDWQRLMMMMMLTLKETQETSSVICLNKLVNFKLNLLYGNLRRTLFFSSAFDVLATQSDSD